MIYNVFDEVQMNCFFPGAVEIFFGQRCLRAQTPSHPRKNLLVRLCRHRSCKCNYKLQNFYGPRYKRFFFAASTTD